MSQKPRSTHGGVTYFQAILPSLPADLSREVHSIRVGDIASSERADACLDNLIRFVAGAEHSDASKQSPQILSEWTEKQNNVSNILKNLVGGSISVSGSLEIKRQRDDEEDAQDDSPRSAKRAKTQPSVNGAEDDADADSPPLFILHSLSVTSPVRKKVDIAVHKNSLRLTHPTTHGLEARITLSALRRAFLLPTRGKPKPHWTVVVLSSDVSTPEQSSGKSSASSGGVQLIFGIDAVAPSAMAVTKAPESSGQPQKMTIPKGSATSVPLRDFLSALSEAKPNGELQILGPTPNVFKSACTSLFRFSSASSGGTNEQNSSVAGIEAYRGAKAGTLWFMKEGILWGESKPCEFWAIEDLAGEGVKTIGSTGRLCTVVISRKRQSEEDEDEEDAVDGDAGVETEFGMVDAREKGPIDDWLRSFVRGRTSDAAASLKGKGKATSKTSSYRSSPSSSAAVPATAERFTINNLHADSDDEEDADFRTDSDGSASGSSSSEDGGEEEEGEEGEEGSDEGEESDEEEEEEEEELRPERHPLMRSGIMPRMSKAVVDMVVGMVEEEMMGGPDEDDELEEDELDE